MFYILVDFRMEQAKHTCSTVKCNWQPQAFTLLRMNITNDVTKRAKKGKS